MGNKKFKRGSSKKFLMLEQWFLDSHAWRDLKPGPRSLYIELKQRFSGGNNGQIFLSQRDASLLLNVGRDTVGKYFEALILHGFLIQTRGHCLGPQGVGQASTYALTELPVNGKPATKEFMAWKKQNPRRIIQHSLAEKPDTPSRKTQHSNYQMLEKPTALGVRPCEAVSENPAINTFNHRPKVMGAPNLKLSFVTDVRNRRWLCTELSNAFAA